MNNDDDGTLNVSRFKFESNLMNTISMNVLFNYPNDSGAFSTYKHVLIDLGQKVIRIYI